jgi:DNA-binding transcriptional regulator YhcF (GntR family)
MRFWLARNSEVPIREQLVTQITLGILSGDLEPGRKLPSTRELARRFRVHANTVSAAYRQMEEDGLLESRRGSGVYVTDPAKESATGKKRGARKGTRSSLAMDQLIAGLFTSARRAGMPLGELRARLKQWVAMQPPDHFLLIEPDADLREIVMAEMKAALTFEVRGCDLDGCKQPALSAAIPVVLPSKAAKVRKLLPEESELLVLQVRSAGKSLAIAPVARAELLVGIASRWPGFIQSAKTMLVAAGFDADSLVLRDARKPGWEKALLQTAGVVCDALTAQRLPNSCHGFPFALVSEASLDELRRYEAFVSSPLS